MSERKPRARALFLVSRRTPGAGGAYSMLKVEVCTCSVSNVTQKRTNEPSNAKSPVARRPDSVLGARHHDRDAAGGPKRFGPTAGPGLHCEGFAKTMDDASRQAFQVDYLKAIISDTIHAGPTSLHNDT